jgi:hypothetical protein
MFEGNRPTPADVTANPAQGVGEPRRTWMSRILQQGPEARRRLGRAVAGLLGTALVSMAALGALLIWHLVRRGRLLRERLGPPRIVRLPELPNPEGNPHDADQDEVSTP